MSNFRYEVDEANVIRIWNDDNPNENGAPFIYQPTQPSGTPWSNKEEAEVWAQQFIDSLENPVVIEDVVEEAIEDAVIVEDIAPTEE